MGGRGKLMRIWIAKRGHISPSLKSIFLRSIKTSFQLLLCGVWNFLTSSLLYSNGISWTLFCKSLEKLHLVHPFSAFTPSDCELSCIKILFLLFLSTRCVLYREQHQGAKFLSTTLLLGIICPIPSYKARLKNRYCTLNSMAFNIEWFCRVSFFIDLWAKVSKQKALGWECIYLPFWTKVWIAARF